uniref:O-methyltransferase dimerisation domain-containing protein n=1 Tax=Nelumbo nucifera TaxID=4432 RepID=A0A822ZJM8_NELNU|nr:TPA_asm: hypothetical protein HUJ06_016261 [Nelumbo nucifera]
MALIISNHFETPNEEKEEENCILAAMQLASASVLPIALKVTTELDVFEIISRAGPDAYLSASEIALHLHTENPDAATMLDRVLSLLTSYSVLKCSLVVKRDNDQVERRYDLAPVCKFFTNSQDGVSLRPCFYCIRTSCS